MKNVITIKTQMGIFQDRFGLRKIRLTLDEQTQIYDELRQVDYKRISFIALISVAFCSFFILLDLLSTINVLKLYYIIIDSILLLISILVLADSNINLKKGPLATYRRRKLIVIAYPFVIISWATAVVTIDPNSVLNLATFYFVLFLVSFAIYAPYIVFAVNIIFVFLTYLFLCLYLKQPFLSETLTNLLVGMLLSIAFYGMFSTMRFNAHAALIKLNKANKNLERKVEVRTKELKNLNENLENEVAHRIVIEKRLINTLKKAEAVNKLKSEFLANISHEVRTPLNAIIGFTEMMTEDGVSESQKKEFQKLVASNTLYLLSTFDDIFDASYVRDEKFKPVNKPMKVNQFVDVLAYETNGIAIKQDKHHLTIKLVKIEDEQFEIITDEFFLKKAMVRLIDNAYKFTPQGTIEIGAKHKGSKLELFVSDTGIGIDKKDYKKIYQPFVQGDGSFSRGYGGSGLGLNIVKNIVEALGCGFELNSELGEGSIFSLIFEQRFFLQNS